jgi:hypothetical protein
MVLNLDKICSTKLDIPHYHLDWNPSEHPGEEKIMSSAAAEHRALVFSHAASSLVTKLTKICWFLLRGHTLDLNKAVCCMCDEKKDEVILTELYNKKVWCVAECWAVFPLLLWYG